jgi:hypothetical protein
MQKNASPCLLLLFFFGPGDFLQLSRSIGYGLKKLALCSHLDHIGALPYFTEVCGYHGPIYMTVSSDEHSVVVWAILWQLFASSKLSLKLDWFVDVWAYCV